MRESELTDKLKSRFCKNNNIPINIFKEPYFKSRLCLYDKYYNTLSLYNQFVESMSVYNNEEEYFETYNKIKELIIQCIQNSEGYQNFIKDDMSQWGVNTKISSNNIYKDDNVGKYFASIDMCEANFSSLYHYDKSIFNGADSYSEFISRFTDDISIINSKYIRQVIFGACNPKRQITYEKYIMYSVLQNLNALTSFCDEKISSFTNDEIVFEVNKDFNIPNGIYILNTFDGKNIKCKLEKFKLSKISGGYIKINDKGGIKIKCAKPIDIPFIIRKLENKPIQEEDLYFYHEGKLAKFILEGEKI